MRIFQKDVYQEYIEHGYLSLWRDCPDRMIADLAELGLIHTEISEAQESIRIKGLTSDVYMELADTVIRCMNFCSRHGFILERALIEKAKINDTKEYLHGKRL